MVGCSASMESITESVIMNVSRPSFHIRTLEVHIPATGWYVMLSALDSTHLYQPPSFKKDFKKVVFHLHQLTIHSANVYTLGKCSTLQYLVAT